MHPYRWNDDEQKTEFNKIELSSGTDNGYPNELPGEVADTSNIRHLIGSGQPSGRTVAKLGRTGVELNQTDEVRAAGLTSQLDGLHLTRLHLLILVGCCIGFSFDLAEIGFGTILSAVFSAPPYSVTSSQLSWLLAAVYIGATIGATTLGWFADKLGRRRVLLCAMSVLAIASLLAGLSPGIGGLIASRALAGISLGAYPPLMFAYLTDILPPKHRGGLVVTATAISYIGLPVFIFMVRWLTPISPLGIEAWRWGFYVGAVGAAISAYGFWRMPESPRWLIAKGRLGDAEVIIEAFRRSRTVVAATEQTPLSSERANAIVTHAPRRSLRVDAIFLIVLYFLTPWATVGFAILSGAVLVQKGINIKDSLLYIGISTIGPILGTLAGGFLVDRAERRSFLALTAILMALSGMAFGATNSPLWLVASALAFNIVVALFLPVLVLYAAEAVSTNNRAKITSWSWTANRVGSALVPVLLLPVLHSQGPLAMFIVIAVTLALFVAILLFFGPRGAAGRSVA